MQRPHVEFIQSQSVHWSDDSLLGLARGARLKLLNANTDRSDCTALIDYRAGTALTPFYRDGSEELFVLAGELVLNGIPLRRHHYAFLPSGYDRRRIECPAGALVLTFLTGGFGDLEGSNANGGLETLQPHIVDASAMEWDGTTIDARLAHLRLSRKILRISAAEPCRTYLLAGLPHGRPAGGTLQLERHEYAEEMFLIAGDMASPQGVMLPGAYFYRPRDKIHGPHFSDNGFFMFLRHPGTTVIRTEWVGEARYLPPDPPYDPILPPDSPLAWREPYQTQDHF
jgi:hypothetical protein